MLAFAGGLAGLYNLRPELVTASGLKERLFRLKVGTGLMAIVAWFTVITGPATAAMISGATGTFVIGLLTTGSVIFEGLREALNWWNPSGPLSGKTALGVIAWLISWAFLNTVWKGKNLDLRRAFIITLIGVILGLILTFQPVFEAFE